MNDVTSASAEGRGRQAQAGPRSGAAVAELSPGSPDSASRLKNAEAERAAASVDLSQDEVQVQRDSQVEDQIVIKFLNQATGDLVLQVPSDEVLSVDRGIYQELEQQAKTQDAAAAALGRDGK